MWENFTIIIVFDEKLAETKKSARYSNAARKGFNKHGQKSVARGVYAKFHQGTSWHLRKTTWTDVLEIGNRPGNVTTGNVFNINIYVCSEYLIISF